MLPPFATNYLGDSLLRYPKRLADLMLAHFSAQFTNSDDISRRQLGVRRLLAACMTLLVTHVLVVVGASAQEKVINIDARRIVATMQDKQAACNFTVCHDPCKAVRKYSPARSVVVVENPVSSTIAITCPFKASVWRGFGGDESPKALLNWILHPREIAATVAKQKVSRNMRDDITPAVQAGVSNYTGRLVRVLVRHHILRKRVLCLEPSGDSQSPCGSCYFTRGFAIEQELQ